MAAPFKLVGEIDFANANSISEQLLDHILDSVDPLADVVIDCSELAFIDSSGLQMLLEMTDRTSRDLTLKGLSDQCRRPFELTGLDEVFSIE
jgi:anti-anti-sigma factor